MTDVTDKVTFEGADDESLPLTKCVCGEMFKSWTQLVSIYPEHPWECPQCHRKLVFKSTIRVFEVVENKPLTPIERMVDAACGFSPEHTARVTLRCPTCKREKEVARHATDPALATVVVIPCGDCPTYSPRSGPEYLDATGKQIT